MAVYVNATVESDNIPITVEVSSDQSVDATVVAGGGGGSISLESKTVSYTPTESAQTDTVEPSTGYDGLSEVTVNVGAIASDYVGSGVTRNDSSDMMISENNPPTILAPLGYYAADATMTVPSGSATTPASSITANPTITVSSSGLITATVNASKSVTPTVTRGWVASGTAGTVTASGSATSQLPLYDGS